MLAASAAASACNGSVETTPNWQDMKHVVEKLHKHVCGLASFGDMKPLLVRNNVWSEDVPKYLSDQTTRYTACRSSKYPNPSRKVSLSALSRPFNDFLCVDHVFLDGMRVIHAMEAYSRYSAGLVCDDCSLSATVHAFEAIFFGPFWPSLAVTANNAFNHDAFVDAGSTWHCISSSSASSSQLECP